METDRPLKNGRSPISLFQLMVGATLAFVGAAAILRLSSLWTITDVRYAEYSLVLLWGVMLMVGALRHR